MKRPCIECGKPTKGTRCPLHYLGRASYQETQRRKATVDEHAATFGGWCPGWSGIPSHPSSDLTADHVYPRARWGDDGPLRVLCRACNSSRQDMPDR